MIASTLEPGIRGGGTLIVDWLADELISRSHEVEKLFIPFSLDPRRLAAQMVGLRFIDLTAVCDRLITIRPPAHLIHHDRKVVWFLHHYRGLFDLLGTRYQLVPPGAGTETLRRMLRDSDELGLSEARCVFAISKMVRDRLEYFNRRDAEVLYPPAPEPSRFRCDGYGDYILGLSRLAGNKRPELLLNAIARCRTDVRLVLAGVSDSATFGDEMRALVRDLGVTDRVTIIDDWISEETKAELLAACLAVAYAPLNEDSYGYPSLEAHLSRKAVLTARDSGGTLELVEHARNGYVLEPDPTAFANAFDGLFEDPTEAARMGSQAFERLSELRIDWDHVVDRLLS